MGAEKVDRYLELGGYEAVKKCLAQGPEWIIEEMKASNLRLALLLRLQQSVHQ